MGKYLRLLRVHHYLKNGLIILPLLFSGDLFQWNLLGQTMIGYLSFCLIASSIYIYNDIQDIEKDKMHPIKKKRPIATGEISLKKAIIIGLLLFLAAIGCQTIGYLLFHNQGFIVSTVIMLGYFIMNLGYSKGLKNVPIIDVMILALGFVLRVLYGGAITNTEISSWLFLTVLSICLFAGFGKRRNEMIKNKTTSRKVLQAYTKSFLDKSMYLFLSLALVFYSLWCTNGLQFIENNLLTYSILFVIFIVLKYALTIEQDSYGDPIDVILQDKLLMIVSVIYIVYMVVAIYA